jgi:pyridoxine 5-phosphate synthase
MTRLSVNVNKVAVLRNSRGGNEPDICFAAAVCLAAGAHGITVHPRPDQRHVRPEDVRALKALIARAPSAPVIEFNIEGNGFAAARGGYPGLLKLVEETRPTQCTLVPDGDGQLTSDHGFDLRADAARLKPLIAELKQLGTRVSLFMDADSTDIARAAEIGADRIEIYTGPFAEAFARGQYQRELDDCAGCSEAARHAGLAVNAGHDLSQRNLGVLKSAIPSMAEVSIGHALIGEALYAGLESTVKAYLRILSV